MAKFTPFPTFGGKDGIAGITPVKLAPTQMRFPTARGPVRRAPEPTDKEKLGGFVPLITEGIKGLIQGRPEVLSDADYLTSIGADPENHTFNEQTRLDAYKLYGPPKEKNRFGLDEILNIGVASQMGRGAKDYGKTYFNLRTAEETDRLNTEKLRAEYIKSQKPTKYNTVNLLSKSDHANGIKGIYQGRENEDTGELELQIKNNDGSFSYEIAGPDYIKQTGVGNVELPENVNVKLVDDILDPIFEKELSITNLVKQGSNTIRTLNDIMDSGAVTPNTITSALFGIGNQARLELDNLQKIGAIGSSGRLFATEKDVENGIAGGDKNAPLRAGTGQLAEQLYLALQSGDTDRINSATLAFEESFLQDKLNNPKGLTIKELLGDVVYDDVTLRSQMLSLAYTAAAVNGQTGRTLSDKDLAYHLQIVGLNQTSDPEILIKNLKRFIGDAVTKVDSEAQLALQQNWFKFDLNDEYTQSAIKQYYRPPESPTPLNDPMNPYNFLYPSEFSQYTFRTLGERYKDIGFEEFTGVNNQPENTQISTDVKGILEQAKQELD